VNTEKVNINKYFLDFNKKSIIDFHNYFEKKSNGNIVKTIEELALVSALGRKEINFLITFCKNTKLIKIDNDEYSFNSRLTKDRFFIDVGKYLLNLIYSDKSIHDEVFINSKLSLEDDYILIDSKTIDIKYTPILTTLSRIGFLKYKGNFAYVENYILGKKLLERPLKKLSISQKEFDKELYEKKLRGELAEKYVLKHEIEKLKNSNFSPIRQSIDDVGLGYDILSFDIIGNEIFIEVKSINNNKFYWSENEIKVSKELKKQYFIYCVRFKDNNPEKIEKIIQDPYDEIFIKNNFEKKSTGDFKVFLK
jgi:hypothetical protein